jgi:RimJ/RimL family protein N-acetyltransferase
MKNPSLILIVGIILFGVTWFHLNKYKLTQKISFKPLQEKNLPLFFKWVKQPHVSRWWKESCNYEEFLKKYHPSKFDANYTYPFIVYLNDKPISYVQYYLVEKADDGWWVKHGGQSPGTLGVDILIGETEYLGKGYGTLILKKFVEKLFKKHNVKKIIIDPNPENIASVRCYQKVGFKTIRKMETCDGPALLMEIKNEKNT